MNNVEMDQRIKSLRDLITKEFAEIGWRLEGNRFVPPPPIDKKGIRLSHRVQRIERARGRHGLIQKHGNRLLQEFAEGSEVNPDEFAPVLVPVIADSWESVLFRFASLLWTVPIREGYGRRMRYLVRDEYNGKLVGLISLMDPVFNLAARDKDIGWTSDQRESRLYNVMDANGLGALPPYNRLLCGKWVALAAVSNQVRSDFAKKYRGRETVIAKVKKKASLVLVTTTSALGRSSIYNRLQIGDEAQPVYRSVGYSIGYGHYQVTDATFMKLRDWLRELGDPIADGFKFGDGPNWRMRTIQKAFDRLGFEGDPLLHGIKRETFVAPLASNYREFLLGQNKRPEYYHRDLGAMTEFFKERWMIPRSQRIDDWRGWTRSKTWRLIAENCELDMNLIMF